MIPLHKFIVSSSEKSFFFPQQSWYLRFCILDQFNPRNPVNSDENCREYFYTRLRSRLLTLAYTSSILRLSACCVNTATRKSYHGSLILPRRRCLVRSFSRARKVDVCAFILNVQCPYSFGWSIISLFYDGYASSHYYRVDTEKMYTFASLII